MRVEQALVRLGVEGVPLLGRRAGVGMRVGPVLGRLEQRVQRRAVGRRAARALRDDGLERARVVEHVELAGRADDAGRGLRVLDAGERDRDLVAGLLADLRLAHAELVDARADDRDRLVDLIACVGGFFGSFGTALSTTSRPPCRSRPSTGDLHDRDDAREPEQDEHGQQDQEILGSVGHATPHTSRPDAEVPTVAASARARRQSALSGSSASARRRRRRRAPATARRATRIDDVGRDLEPHLVAVERHDRAVDAADRDDLIAARERAEQLALPRHHARAAGG